MIKLSGRSLIALKALGVLAGLGFLAIQLYGMQITADPDPDGYVSYAQGLAETWRLQAHRRMPGYPFLIVVVNWLGAADLHVDMFRFHLILTVAFAAATTLLVWRLFGYAVAIVYLAIFAYNSYFAHAAMMMFADLPFVITFYLTCGAGLAFYLDEGRRRYVWALLFLLLTVVSTAVHPSHSIRMQVLLWAALAVMTVRHFWDGQSLQSPQLRAFAFPIVLLCGLALLGNEIAFRTLQVQDLPGRPASVENASNFAKRWLSYRMYLCLPPPREQDAFDRKLEGVKTALSKRVGYPVEAIVPPGWSEEFLLAFRSEPEPPLDHWQRRFWEHPFALAGCMLSELRAKYFFTVRNLTPFTAFETDKTWITPTYPPNTGSPRDALFWTTGISFFGHLAPNTDAAAVASAALREVARISFVLALTIAGLVLIERRFRNAGWIIGLSTLGLLVVLSAIVPVETRYLLPQIPILYLAQALCFVHALRYVVTREEKSEQKPAEHAT